MGGQLSSRPHGRNHHLVSVGHPASLLGRTPGATHALLDLHVHRADVACLVLSNPQLPVFGWVYFLKQLVHRLDCLQETEKRGHSQRWQLDRAAHAFVPVRAASYGASDVQRAVRTGSLGLSPPPCFSLGALYPLDLRAG